MHDALLNLAAVAAPLFNTACFAMLYAAGSMSMEKWSAGCARPQMVGSCSAKTAELGRLLVGLTSGGGSRVGMVPGAPSG